MNVIHDDDATHEIIERDDGTLRNKLRTFDVKGLPYKEKRDMIHKEIMDTFDDIPDGIHFSKMQTKKNENNPDGYRVLVSCDWLTRQRFYDRKGVYGIGRLVKAINKEIKGITRDRLKKPQVKIAAKKGESNE